MVCVKYVLTILQVILRAIETSEIISGIIGKDFITDFRLRERNLEFFRAYKNVFQRKYLMNG